MQSSSSDAYKAFNYLNHQVALQNIRILCPPVATILVYSYRAPTNLSIAGEVFLLQEGTTQGDSLVMVMYALGTIPLIKKVNGNAKQVWYANDDSAMSLVSHFASGETSSPPLTQTFVIMPTQGGHG